MDNVLNRPLFRHREARNRLNDIAGVQRFEVGGPVRPQGLPSLNRMAAYQANMGLPDQPLSEREKEAEELGSAVRSFLGNIDDRLTGALIGAGTGLYGLSVDVLSPVFATLGATSLAAELERKSDMAYNYAISNLMEGFDATVGLSAADFDLEPAEFDLAIARAKSDAEAGRVKPSGPRTESRAPGDRQGPMEYVSPEEVAGTKPLPKPRLRPGTPGDRQAPMDYSSPKELAAVAAAAKGPSAMEADARGRGPMITDPAAVAAGLNAEDPAVREKTVADFMKEFTAAAPEYEGTNKNLMLAQIGFAIAAGESPNAMQNIANGLLAGSDMMLKDKAAKDEFDRSVKLSAMEYGLQQAGNQRSRDEEPLNFVALEDTVYKGRKVKAGQAVYIPFGEIEKNGGVVPEGFGDSSMVTAINERANRAFEIIEKDREERLIDDTVANTLRKEFGESADRAIAAQRGIDYMESALITIGEGGVVGLKGSANQVIKDGLALFGIEAATQFSQRDEALALVAKGFQNLIPVAFSGTQTGNSISNFDVQQLANAYVDAMLKDGVFSLANVTEAKLNSSLKGALELLESGRQSALTNMNGIEGQLIGRKLRSGVDATSIVQPSRERIPQEEDIEVPSVLGSLYRSEDGVYRLRLPGG